MLEDKIANDYKQAMRNKEAIKVSTLSFLRSQLKYAMIDKKLDKLPDPDVITVIKKQVKQRQDSIEQYEKGNRQDLADKEKAEWAILKSFLPEEMSPEALKKIIEESIKETQSSGLKDMGKLMQAVMPKVSGQADNKLVSTLVKERLSQG